ncbi:MAG: hypothetical protein SGARI_003563 [Bacillariaceae sp.]
MDPDFGPKPDPGGDDDSSGIDLLLETSSSNDGDNVSDFSQSEGEQNWGPESGHSRDWEKDRDGDDDDDSRPDPSSRGNSKPDPYMDGDSEFDVENPHSGVFVEDVIEDEYFPHLPEFSDGSEPVEIIEETVDYPPDDENGDLNRERSDSLDDEPSKGDQSEETTKERRIITFLSIAVCILILLIAIAIGVGIGE